MKYQVTQPPGKPSAMIRLYTRGDDAASCESANKAIASAATEGVLRNTSVMACGLAFEHAVPLLRQLQDSIDLGFHVCLNAEWDDVKWGPILPARSVPSLVEPGGMFTRHPGILHERGFDLGEAMAEVEAQYDRLIDAGLKITYLDQHMGVGWVRGLELKLQQFAAQKGLLWVDHLSFVPYHQIDALTEGDHIWVTHPGKLAPDMIAFSHEGLSEGQIARERAAETEQLLRPAFQSRLDSGEMRVCRFSDGELGVPSDVAQSTPAPAPSYPEAQSPAP